MQFLRPHSVTKKCPTLKSIWTSLWRSCFLPKNLAFSVLLAAYNHLIECYRERRGCEYVLLCTWHFLDMQLRFPRRRRWSCNETNEVTQFTGRLMWGLRGAASGSTPFRFVGTLQGLIGESTRKHQFPTPTKRRLLGVQKREPHSSFPTPAPAPVLRHSTSKELTLLTSKLKLWSKYHTTFIS